MKLRKGAIYSGIFLAMLCVWLFCQPTTVIDVPITIKGNIVQEVQTFGLDVVFDPNVYEYQGTEKGSLTQDWAQVDGNVIEPGRARVGGYYGSGTVITGNVDGSLAVVKFKFVNSEITLENFVDDIRNMEQASTAVVSVSMQ